MFADVSVLKSAVSGLSAGEMCLLDEQMFTAHLLWAGPALALGALVTKTSKIFALIGKTDNNTRKHLRKP